MASPDNVLTRLQTLAAAGASGIATQGSIAAKSGLVGGTGFAAGRMVYDSVTGQFVEVVGSTVAYIALPAGGE